MEDKSRFYPDHYGWWEVPDAPPCFKCQMPMHIASGQDVQFCPNCAIDRKNAVQGRAMLALVKARFLYKQIEEADIRRSGASDQGPQGVLWLGIPL